GPGAHVDGVGVGQERAAAGLPEVVHHPAHEDGADERGVAPLAEMELHPDQGPLLLAPDDALDRQGLQEPLEFLEIGLLGAGPEVHEEYLAGHIILLVSSFEKKPHGWVFSRRRGEGVLGNPAKAWYKLLVTDDHFFPSAG